MAGPALRPRLRRFDWGLFLATVLLTTIGLAAIASLSLNQPQPDLTTFSRQVVFVVVGLVVVFGLSVVDYRFFRSTAWILYGLGLLALVSVLIFGTAIRGTRGWFAVFGQTVQPVEFVKVMLILVLAKVLADHYDERRHWRTLGLTGLVLLPLIILVFLQPDLGAVLMLLAVWFGVLVFIRLPLRSLSLLLLTALVIGALSWFVVLQDFQRERILTFLDPSRDPLGVGYNLRQAKVAVGSGQLFGRGLGLGPQSQLDFLPVQETDFIFAVIAEELGFVGGVMVFGLYAFFFLRLLRILRQTTDDFASFVVAGIASLLFVQTVVNIGMNIGLVPVAGLPLPFLSYGGSALIASLAMVGLVESIAIRSRGERVGLQWGARRES